MVDSHVPARLGDAQHTPTLRIQEECHIQHNGATMPYEDTSERPSKPRRVGIFLHRGRILSAGPVTLKSSADIALGLLELHPTGVLELPKPGALAQEGELRVIRNIALGSKARLLLETPGDVLWHQVEIQTQDLEVRAHYVDHVSSEILVKGHAILPNSCHRLILVDKGRTQTESHQNQYNKIENSAYFNFGSKRYMGPSTHVLSHPAKMQVGGCFETQGQTKLIASELVVGDWRGAPPTLDSVITKLYWMWKLYDGHHKYKHASWHDYPNYGRTHQTIQAKYSISTALVTSSSVLDLNGIMSTLALNAAGIEQGRIGHFNLNLRLPSPSPFRTRLCLADYFQSSAFLEAQVGGDTVYKSLLENALPGLSGDPLIVLHANSTLSPARLSMRRLYTSQQEERLLVLALMSELGRHFLGVDLREPAQMLSAFKHQAGRLAIENNTQALILRHGDLAAPKEVFLYYREQVCYDSGQGVVETVLVPELYLPERLNNPRLRSGAGCVYALGDITFKGVQGGVLNISGNISTEGVVTFSHLAQVRQIRRTVTELQAITQETRTSRFAGSDKVYTHTVLVPVTHLEPGNEIEARGVHYEQVDTVLMSGLRTDVGEQGYIIRGAKQVVDAAIVRNVIGSTQTDRQRGLLGMGGSMTTYQPVTQQAIGSQIHSIGPVYIETELGIFEATNFGKSQATLQVRELHYHELLRAMEARDRDVAEKIRQAKRTAKRKQRQGTMWLLISLPVSAYVGGLVSGWLSSAMGVTIKATVVNGVTTAATASLAETAFIVGTAGAASGGVAAAIQKQPIFKGALNAAPFAIAGNLVANSPALANSGFMVQTLAQTAAASSLHAFLHGRLSLENLVVAFGAAVVAESVVPSSDNDSIGRDVFRAATSTTVMALLSNGTIQSLATSLMAAGVGASAGRMAAQQGEQHGTVLHQGRVFKKELTRVSEHASQALVAEGIHVPAKQIKKQLQRHPALQGSPEEVQARLIQRGAIEEGDSVQTGAAASLARGVAKVLGATLDLLIPSAHTSEFTQEEYNQLHGYTDRQHEVRHLPRPGAIEHEAEFSWADWSKEFGTGAVGGVGAGTALSLMARSSKLLPFVQGLGGVGLVAAAVEGMQLEAQFGRDHFDLTDDFENMMRNPMISEARQQEMWSNSRQNLARLEGQKAKSLSQVIKDNPRPLGLVFGGMLGLKLKFPTISTPEPFSEVALVGNARSLTPSYQAHRARHSVPAPMSSMERDFYSKSELVGVFNYEHRGRLRDNTAATFMGDHYRTYKLREDHFFYRSGSTERELGQFFSFEKPTSVIQTRIDNALPLFWSDGKPCVINTAYTIKVPKDTIVHVGESTQQGGVFLGGTPQIVIENPRLIDGLKVVEKFSLEEYQKYGKK